MIIIKNLKLVKFIFILLITIVITKPVFAKTKSIKVICFDISDNKVLDEYNLYGNEYNTVSLQAKEIPSHYIVGNNIKKIVFGIDYEVEFFYEQNVKGNINYKTHEKYVNGYPDGNFYPDEKITWGEAVTLLYAINEIKKFEIPVHNKEIWYDEALQYLQKYNFTDFDDGDKKFIASDYITKGGFINLAINYIDKYADKNVIDAFLQTDTLESIQITRGECIWVTNKLLKRDGNILTHPTIKNLYNDINEKHPLYETIIEASISHYYLQEQLAEKWLSIDGKP